MNKKKLGMAVGALALAAATVGMAGQVSALAYSDLIAPNGSKYWSDGSVTGYVQAGTRGMSLWTRVSMIHDYHHTQTEVLCSDNVVYPWGQHVDPDVTNLRKRIDYICPNFTAYRSGQGRLINY